MKLTDFLTEKNIIIGIDGKKKDEIIGKLVEIAHSVYPEIDKDAVMNGILAREKLCSTGIGENVAIPHAGIDGCSEILPVLAVNEKGVKYDSIDGKSVKIIFMIIYPKKYIKTQLQFLARVSRLLRNDCLRESLIKSSSPKEVMRILNKYESEHFS